MDREAVAEARYVLGRALAERRRAAGYTQERLAPLTGYGRSTVANVEVGRQNVPRGFWERCDSILSAGGLLLDGYDGLITLSQEQNDSAYLLRLRRSTNSSSSRRDLASDDTPSPALVIPRSDGWLATCTSSTAAVDGRDADNESPLADRIVTESDDTFTGSVDGEEPLRRGLDQVIGSHLCAGSAQVEDWEGVVLRHGRASREQPARVLLDDLTVDLGDLHRAVLACRSPSTFRRLIRVTAQLATLVCLAVIKLDDRQAFRRWARTARVAAAESGDSVVHSWVRAHEAHGYYYMGDLAEAVRVARHARELAGSTSVGTVLAAALEARAHAAMGRGRETHNALDRAEAALSRLDRSLVMRSACGYDEAQLRFHEENALTRLGDSSGAWRAQTRALELYPEADYLDRTLIQLDRAACLLHDGDPGGAVTHVTETLTGLPQEQRGGIVALRAHEVVRTLPAVDRARPAARELQELLMSSAALPGR